MLLVFFACASAIPSPDTTPPTDVPLTWYRAAAGDSWDTAAPGLDWALTQLGGAPPGSGAAWTVVDAAPETVDLVLHLDELKLDETAIGVLLGAAAELRASGNRADLGRFLMLTLHEPWRYYAITAACPTLQAWTARHQQDTAQYAVTTSLLVEGERRITLNTTWSGLSGLAYTAEEGTGALEDATFNPVETEVVDVMDNGQFRYAVYDTSGALVPVATASPAGTPGKCAWCHERTLHPGTSENQSAPGYLTYTDWIDHWSAAQGTVDDARAALGLHVDYVAPLVHEETERIVEGFLRPDAGRVALEWGVDEAAVRAVLGVGAEVQDEFGWSERYLRADVDAAGPIVVPTTLASARELGTEDIPASAETPGCR